MEIRTPRPVVEKPFNLPSVITIKNTIQLGHEDTCTCDDCSTPQLSYFKYVQPEIPKSFKPLHIYKKSDIPIESHTTYKLSFWDNPGSIGKVEPIRQTGTLTVGDGKITDETVHKLSYLGNWNIKKEGLKRPRRRTKFCLIGKGPMQDCTTNKQDFTWKQIARSKPLKASNNLYCPQSAMTDDTTYKLSYYESIDYTPVKSCKPEHLYEKNETPLDERTTYNLSYFPNEVLPKESYPWSEKKVYEKPQIPIDDQTTYNLSYWPNDELVVREPINAALQPTQNLLNVGNDFEDSTTYNLSYFSCGENVKRDPIRPKDRPSEFASCPLSSDTVNRLSYLGIWDPKMEDPIIRQPCLGKWFIQGPLHDATTHKDDFTWKYQEQQSDIRPENNFEFSSAPLESFTTHKLSFLPNDVECIVKEKSFNPSMSHKYQPPDVPFEADTIMQLSYQPLERVVPQDKPWARRSEYHPPLIPMEDNTIYNQSFIPPGYLEPLTCDDPSFQLSNMCQAI